jgi:probable F420-dependent oxidoreductase
MKLALFGINFGALATPEASAKAARTAEAAGYESLWAGEHVVLPEPRTPDSPLPSRFPMLDPVVAFGHLSAVTSKVRLGTGIIILPQRNPVVLAKELASLDVLSSGRLIFGVGVGYLKPEFDAIGAVFAERGARTDEYMAAIKALWTMEQPAFSGRFVNFAGIDAQPRPVQRPHPPIVTGGWTGAAFARAVQHANGWYGYNMDVETVAKHIAALRAVAARTERPAALGNLEISVTPPRATVDLDMAQRYHDLGVDRLILQYTQRDADGIVGEIEQNMERLRPALA